MGRKLCSKYSVYYFLSSIDAEFDVSVEDEELSDREVKKEGWKVKTNKFDEKVNVMKLKISDDKLPVTKSLGRASFSITISGLVSMGISVGDSDASSSSTLQLPVVSGKLFPLGHFF